jgi:GNAT superfamily N-acetyltransferase
VALIVPNTNDDSKVDLAFELGFLLNHAQFLPIIALWQYMEWGHLVENDSTERRMKELEGKLQTDRLPLSMIAFSGDRLFGAIDIVVHDLPTYHNLSPWLTNLFVEQSVRRKGVGSTLFRFAVTHAHQMGIRDIFLYTWDHESFYRKLGCILVEESEYFTRRISIMKIDCTR